ncbi:MAG: fluoride efflux transporter CrcB [Alphaproteobacteria bacterium]|nr:fluoride efflux transporter CrcB [Alphaproteobacteria bacterium]
MFSTIGAIALGGATGAIARFGVNHTTIKLFGADFPWGTMIVNVVGSFLMGVVIVKFAHMDGVSPALRSFIVTGFLGAFTTFSTFSLDFATLWERGDMMQSFAYMLASVVLSISALFLAFWFARGFLS